MPDLVLYDGGCGLCHWSVAFLARRDRDGSRFRFAPIGGETAAARLPGAETSPAAAGTVVLIAGDGAIRTRSDAVLFALGRLGGPWRLLAAIARVAPRPLRDGAYSLVARFRRRLLAPPDGSCPRVEVHLADRFLP